MIKKYLELCTSHLTEETVNSLNTVQPPYSYQYPYGVFIIVPDRSSEEEFADFFRRRVTAGFYVCIDSGIMTFFQSVPWQNRTGKGPRLR